MRTSFHDGLMTRAWLFPGKPQINIEGEKSIAMIDAPRAR
jgi:hypothetical protein